MPNPFTDDGFWRHKIIKRRFFKAGYEVRYIEVASKGNPTVTMPSAFTPRGEYIGDPKFARRMIVKAGIMPELIDAEARTCSIGYCAKDGRWHGWSHRARYGFGIGSRVKKGDCGYVTSSRIEMMADLRKEFPENEYRRKIKIYLLGNAVHVDYEESTQATREITRGKRKGECVPDGPIVWEKRTETFPLGRGEWTAKTIGEAREMAVAFAEGVS